MALLRILTAGMLTGWSVAILLLLVYIKTHGYVTLHEDNNSVVVAEIVLVALVLALGCFMWIKEVVEMYRSGRRRKP